MTINISTAAQLSGVSAKMIRYYEEYGLIPPIDRDYSGYRNFTMSDVHKLQFIRRCRELGFSLTDIENLLKLWQDQSRQSSEVKKFVQLHMANIQEKINDLQKIYKTLEDLSNRCHGSDHSDCPILNELGNIKIKDK